jgi:hypothetical protein
MNVLHGNALDYLLNRANGLADPDAFASILPSS